MILCDVLQWRRLLAIRVLVWWVYSILVHGPLRDIKLSRCYRVCTASTVLSYAILLHESQKWGTAWKKRTRIGDVQFMSVLHHADLAKTNGVVKSIPS